MFDSEKSQSLMNVIIGLCLMSFFIGAFVSGERRWFSNIIALHISNETGTDIRELKIIARYDTDETIVSRHNIPKDEKFTIEVLAMGGGVGYITEAIMPNGFVIESKTGYVTSDTHVTLKLPKSD